MFLSVKPVLSVVVGLFFAGYLGRHLGVTRYGNFTYALSFVTMFSVIANFGVNTVLQRECSAAGADVNKLFMNSVYLKTAFLFLTVLTVLAAAVLLGASPVILSLNVILSVYIIGLSLQNSFASVFKGTRDTSAIAIVDTSSQFIDIALIVSILWLGGMEIGIAWGKVALVVLGLVLYLILFRRKFGLVASPFDPGMAKRFLQSGFYITVITVFLPVYHQIGPVILGSISGMKNVGIYQAANGFVDKLLMFAMPFNEAVFPIMAGSVLKLGDRDSGVDFHFYFKTILILASGAWIGTYYAGPMLVDLFFGPEYAEARGIVRIMAVSIGFRVINNFCGTIFLARRNERVSSFLVAVQAAILVCFCFLLIPRLGAAGVAYAFVAAEGISLVMRIALIGRMEMLPMPDVLWKFRKFWGFVGVFILLNGFSAYIDMKPIYNLVFLPLFPMLMFMFGIMNWKDILAFKKKVLEKNPS